MNLHDKSVSDRKIIQLSQKEITENTPMGCRILPDGMGATVRVWAPAAQEVGLLWDYYKDNNGAWLHRKEGKLHRTNGDLWSGFVPDIKHMSRYMFYIKGPEVGTEGLKRDPYALDLTEDPMWPECQCVAYNTNLFPWHDYNWIPPKFHELIIYQLHIGTFCIPQHRNNGTFLDIIDKLSYLKSLGINAIQPLPVTEFPTMHSLGYNGVDMFSPETDFSIREDDPLLDEYLQRINNRMSELDVNLIQYKKSDIIGSANQFRMMIDMCHIYGIAVLLDVVYNHAGGDFGDKSIYFLDRKPYGNNNDSLYFTDRGHAGGLVFAYWKDKVKQFLIDNAKQFLIECHCDGFRYDQVSVIKDDGGEHGWKFCQYVTDTCKYIKPEAIHIAECWPVQQAIVDKTDINGAGFDASLNDGLRIAVRNALSQASSGSNAFVDMNQIAQEMATPILHDTWRAIQNIENHDIVYKNREQRIPKLADYSDSRSWYARSRSRVAMGITMTSIGIPHIFMGQEFLEDKQWSDEPGSSHQIWWDGLHYDKEMIDFLRFTRELISVRNQYPALKSVSCNIFHVHNGNRILALHRWVASQGQDVVIVISLNETTYWNYELGFPVSGYWKEVFNSDIYDNWVNPLVSGNGGGIHAYGNPMHGMGTSATLVIPANSIVILAK